MKKFILFVLTLMLIASMAVPAFAATPSVGVPDIPDFSDIKFDIKFDIPDSVWDKWFDEHPLPKFNLPDGWFKERTKDIFW